jgi:hypothetical protein
MITWTQANSSDIKLLAAIKTSLKKHPQLIQFIFDRDKPQLRKSSEKLLYESYSFSSGEYLQLDLWSASGNVNIDDIVTILDENNFINVLNGLIQRSTYNYKIIKIDNLSNETELES